MRVFRLKQSSKKFLAVLLGSVALVNVWLIMTRVPRGTPRPPADRLLQLSNVGTTSPSDERGGTQRAQPRNLRPDALSCPSWCLWHTNTSRGDDVGSLTRINREGPYYLTAVISVRVYDWKDHAKLGTNELKQWLHYMSYAGVEHVYLYDAYAFKNESQEDKLAEFVASGFLTYTDWHHKAVPFSLGGTQAAAYGDCITKWQKQTVWQLAIDMDEYPFCPRDQNPGFLLRYLRNFTKSFPGADRFTELAMQNYLFLGKPLDIKTHPLLIDRIWRRSKNPANQLVKPIVKPAAVHWPDIHRNSLKYGERMVAPDSEIRMNHYWGARLQNWGEDTSKVLDMTQEDRSMEPVIDNLYRCSRCRQPRLRI